MVRSGESKACCEGEAEQQLVRGHLRSSREC